MSWSHDPTQLAALAANGYELIPLNAVEARDPRGRLIGKAPMGSKWRLLPAMSVDEAEEHMHDGKNVGVRLRPDDLVLDADPRNYDKGDDPLARLAADLGVDLDAYPKVVTGSGGFHIYMKKPANALLRDTLEDYPGLEFKAHGRQVVAPGSVHPGQKEKEGKWVLRPGGSYRWDDDPLAYSLAEARLAPERLIELARRPDFPTAATAGNRSPEELERMLDALDATRFREHEAWFKLMCACHHATGGEGRDEFIAWSTGDPEFSGDGPMIGRRWDTLHVDPSGRRITEKTLFKALVDQGRTDLLPRDKAADDFDGVEEVSEYPKEQNGQGGIAEEFVWIVEAECFVRRSDNKRFSAQQFKSLHAGAWKEGDILNAIWRDKLPMRKFVSMVYLPWENEVVADGHGGRSYNIWRDSGVSAKPGDVTVFLEHMAYMFPDEAERELAIDYLALLVRRPAVKINFAMLVKSRQGTGKSWLGSLIAKIIGEPNVSRPSNTAVVEKYTDWQLGAQLAIIEELMAMGRIEVANRLKPAITDDYLSIRPMYGKVYSVPNRLNFLCFTNHDDALPIESGDRRWLVFFSDATRAEDAYYDRLFAFLEGDGPAHVAHWLGQRHVKLSPKGTAPKTRGKEEMRSLSMGDAEQHLSELLAEREAPFDFGLIRLEDVLAAVPERIARQARNLRNRARKWLDEEAGAKKLARYTKGDRPAVQLWTIDDHGTWIAKGPAACNDAYHERYPTS